MKSSRVATAVDCLLSVRLFTLMRTSHLMQQLIFYTCLDFPDVEIEAFIQLHSLIPGESGAESSGSLIWSFNTTSPCILARTLSVVTHSSISANVQVAEPRTVANFF